MSAWRIGTDAGGLQRFSVPSGVSMVSFDVAGSTYRSAETPTSPLKSYVDTLAKWIPAEVLTFFAAATTALRSTLPNDAVDGAATPHSGWLLLGGLFLAGLLTLIGVLVSNLETVAPAKKASKWEKIVRVSLSVIAFLVLSLTLPGSWWSPQEWNAGVVVMVVAGFAIAYVPLADYLAAYAKSKR